MACCTKPNLYRAWAPRKPFGKSTYCENYGDLTLVGGVHGWLFDWFIAMFWDGTVMVTDEPVAHE